MKNQLITSFSQIVVFSFLSLIVFKSNADASSYRVFDGNYRFSYDHIELPDNEKMGLFAGNYLVDLGDYFYFGLGVYGAVYGMRGGFFTGGLEAGISFPLWRNFGLDVGYFAGGGGGGAAPQGGGLMLRPHAELTYRHNNYHYGLGVSRVDFPNGHISSNQFTISAQRHFRSFLSPGRSHVQIKELDAQKYQRTFLPEVLAYFPFNGTRGTNGSTLDSRMDVIGIRWREHWQGNWWGDFGTGGAWGGRTDGFAQVFIGGAYEFRILPVWSVMAGFQLGAAGGGGVDTGGGLISRANLNSLFSIGNQWLWLLEGGAIKSFDGTFSGLMLSTGLAYKYDILRPNPMQKQALLAPVHVQWADFRVRAGLQRYAHYIKGNGRKSSDREAHPIDQVHVKIDAFATEYVFFSGQALGAFDGDVGGYAVGLIGPGVYFPVLPRVAISLEGLFGAAGGGGVAAGGGRIVQPMLSLDIEISKYFELEISGGYIKAVDGDLEAWVADAGIGYRFSVPHAAMK